MVPARAAEKAASGDPSAWLTNYSPKTRVNQICVLLLFFLRYIADPGRSCQIVKFLTITGKGIFFV